MDELESALNADVVLDQVLAEGFLAGIEDWTAAELRTKRDLAEQAEGRVSYSRRILQGRIDLLRGEAENRDGGDDLLGRLSAMLADRGGGPRDPVTVRIPRTIAPPEAGDTDADAEVLHLGDLDDDALRDLATRYADLERQLSGLRRQLFDVIDRLQAELAERYRSGATSVTELLASD